MTSFSTSAPRYGLARVLSKRGICSRTEAARWIAAGRVSLHGRIVRDPEYPSRLDAPIAIDDVFVETAKRIHVVLNKPRGLITTVADERGRDSVYRCFEGALLDGAPLPWLAPVGRLDKASEGLLLFCNDPQWAARVLDPAHCVDKTYHVQIGAIPDDLLPGKLVEGVQVDQALLRAKSVRCLRVGQKNAWLEIVLDEGRNRQIRRLLDAFDIDVLRLVRVAIGAIALGDLPKGDWRQLREEEVRALAAGNQETSNFLPARAGLAACVSPSTRPARGRCG